MWLSAFLLFLLAKIGEAKDVGSSWSSDSAMALDFSAATSKMEVVEQATTSMLALFNPDKPSLVGADEAGVGSHTSRCIYFMMHPSFYHNPPISSSFEAEDGN